MRKSISKALIMMLVLTTILGGYGTVFAEDGVKVTILETSDLHGRIYNHDYATDSVDQKAGLAKVATLVKQERAKDASLLLVDNGDLVQDNSVELFNDQPVHPMIEALNALKYNAWNLGNHEFNYEKSFLEKNIKTFKGDVLSANIYKKGTTDRFVKPYMIYDVKGVKVCVVGLIAPAVPQWEASSPSHFEGLSFTEPTAELAKVMKEIDGKYDVLVGLFHIGPTGEYDYKGAEDIAKAFPQFNAIFMGHAHANYNKEINGVKLIEPGVNGFAVAKADIELTQEGGKYKVKTVTTSNLETEKAEPDQDLLSQFKYVHDKSIADANTVVGKIKYNYLKSVDLITGADKVTTVPRAQVEDTALVDLINNVQAYYAKADVSSAALFNNNSNLKAGDFKKKDVAFVYKYPNTLVGVKITGENLVKYMEWSASYYNTAKANDVTVSFNPEIRGYNYDMFSGLTYKIDITKEAGSRISDVKIKNKPINPKGVYKLALNNYRFGTLLGLKLVTDADKYYDSYELMQDKGRIRDLIIKYTTDVKKGVLSPTLDNNWKLTGAGIDAQYKALQGPALQLIKDGKVQIPVSEDGRTPNVKSVNLVDLVNAGTLQMPAAK